MEPTPELLDQLRREDIEQARAMSISDRLRAGGDLFDYACEITLSGIRFQNPGISDTDALNELRRRLSMVEARENRR